MCFKKNMLSLIIIVFLTLTFLPAFAETAEEWKVKGNECIEEKDWEEALECYEKSLEVDPDYARSIHNIGYVYYLMKDYDKALEYYDKALALAESGKDRSQLPPELTLSNKGYLFISMARFEEALLCFDKALEFTPEDPALWYNKGNVFYSIGKYEEAVRCFDKALEFDPEYTKASRKREDALKAISEGK